MVQTLTDAVLLLGALDREVLSIAALSLRVSLTAVGLACLVGLLVMLQAYVAPFTHLVVR